MKAVQRTWCTIKKDEGEVGRAFFCLMFDRRPELLRFFSFRGEADWRNCAGLKRHAATVMRMVRV